MSATLYPMPEFNSLGIAVPAPANGVAGDFSGGSVIATGGTTQRTLALRAADQINVRDYGATGNGTTDDTAAVQAAFTAASTKNSEVWFPPGNYLQNGAVTANIGVNSLTVRGAGAGVSILLCHSNGPAITTGSNSRVTVMDLSIINATGTTQNTGLSITSPDQSTIAFLQRLMIWGGDPNMSYGWQTGISLTCIGNPIIRACYIAMRNGNGTPNATGIYYTGNPTTQQYATGLWVTGGTIIQGGQYAINVGPYTQGIQLTSMGAIGNDYGCYWPWISGSNVLFMADNILLQTTTAGVTLGTCTSVMITNCLFDRFNQGAVPNWTAISMQSTIYAAITGNELRGWNSGTELAINWTGGGDGTITGNKFAKLNGHAISGQANLQRVTVSGNITDQITGQLFFNNGITSTMIPTIQILGNNREGQWDITETSLLGGSVLKSYGGLAVQGSNPLTGNDWQTQGGYISWNYATLGETNFVNSSGGGGGGFTFWNVASSISATPQQIFSIRPNGFTTLTALLPNAANDAAAATAGVVVGQFYRNGSQLMVRVT